MAKNPLYTQTIRSKIAVLIKETDDTLNAIVTENKLNLGPDMRQFLFEQIFAVGFDKALKP